MNIVFKSILNAEFYMSISQSKQSKINAIFLYRAPYLDEPSSVSKTTEIGKAKNSSFLFPHYIASQQPSLVICDFFCGLK